VAAVGDEDVGEYAAAAVSDRDDEGVDALVAPVDAQLSKSDGVVGMLQRRRRQRNPKGHQLCIALASA